MGLESIYADKRAGQGGSRVKASFGSKERDPHAGQRRQKDRAEKAVNSSTTTTPGHFFSSNFRRASEERIEVDWTGLGSNIFCQSERGSRSQDRQDRAIPKILAERAKNPCECASRRSARSTNERQTEQSIATLSLCLSVCPLDPIYSIQCLKHSLPYSRKRAWERSSQAIVGIPNC